MSTDQMDRRRGGFGHYLAVRFPPLRQGGTTLVTYAAMLVVFLRSTPGSGPDWRIVLGAVTFVLLFLHLRMIDDLDDFERDVDDGRDTGVGERARLRRWLVLTVAAVVVLNVATWPLLLVALAVTALALLAPVLARRRDANSNQVPLFVTYEGAPALLMLYGTLSPMCWGAKVSVAPAVGTALAFWSGYQLWKLSRKLDEPGYRPYRLTPDGRVAASAVLLVLVAAGGLLTAPPPDLLVCFLVLPLGFLGWLGWWRWRATARPYWAGLTFVVALEVALLLTSAVAVLLRQR